MGTLSFKRFPWALEPVAASGFGAVDAHRDGGVQLEALGPDLLAAVDAVAVFAVLDALEGGVDALESDFPAPSGLQRHRLGLQGVHPGQSADRRLVQLDRLAGFLADVGEAEQLFAFREQAGFYLLGVDGRCPSEPGRGWNNSPPRQKL